jgi:hypothetical protein
MAQHIFIRGNSKLGKDVLVFNLPPGGKKQGGTCKPTAWCSKNCYAMKGLHTYPSVTKANEKRKEWSKQKNFAELATSELKRTKKPYVRIHSSGDFYSEEYVQKWIEICKSCPEKKFLAFTKSHHLSTSLKVLARLKNVSLYESLDESRQRAKTPFLRAMLEGCDLASESAAKKRTRETIKCPGECEPCEFKCWDRDKHVVFHKH